VPIQSKPKRWKLSKAEINSEVITTSAVTVSNSSVQVQDLRIL